MGWTSLNQLATPYSDDPKVNGLILTEYPTYSYELPFKNYIDFSFDTSNYLGTSSLRPVAMTDLQKQGVRNALNYVHEITGINFNEISKPGSEDVDLFFGYASLPQYVLGLDQLDVNYKKDTSGFFSQIDRYDSILLSTNYDFISNLTPGAEGYETLLHEIGHSLGLTDVTVEKSLALNLDNKDATIMSYNTTQTKNHTCYGPLDLAALNWIYGGDGLLGQYGLTIEDGFPVARGGQASSAAALASG
jgi:serralysin